VFSPTDTQQLLPCIVDRLQPQVC